MGDRTPRTVDTMAAMEISTEFIHTSRRYLSDEYLPKIDRCLQLLSNDELWWGPNEHTNSIGNLVLHLEGNVRQYIVSGVGRAQDVRRRDHEFASDAEFNARELRERLGKTIAEVSSILDQLESNTLAEEREIQGRTMTVFQAIYHAVEHFSMHTGQIIHITKQLTDRDLEFYTFHDGSVQKLW